LSKDAGRSSTSNGDVRFMCSDEDAGYLEKMKRGLQLYGAIQKRVHG
jgi:hypothetical protein